MSKKIAVTLTPEEALRLGLMQPVAEHEIIKPIGKAFMEYAETQNFGSTSFILTLLQVIYNTGRIEGIRAERNRTRRTLNQIFMEEYIMKIGTAYISVICVDYETVVSKEKLIADTYHPDNMFISGNELLIPVPENKGMGFSLNQLKELVAPGARVDMFNFELDLDGQPTRFWYCS